MQKKNKIQKKRLKSDLIKISSVIPLVKESLGFDRQIKLNALNEIWPLVTSFDIAKKSHIAYFDKGNNLVIAVKSSVLATELSMQKTSILARLKEATKNTDISFKDLRFINR